MIDNEAPERCWKPFDHNRVSLLPTCILVLLLLVAIRLREERGIAVNKDMKLT